MPRPGILDVAPYVGGESKAAGANRVIRLASNENPLGPSPKAVVAYAAEQDDLHRYPRRGRAGSAPGPLLKPRGWMPRASSAGPAPTN